MAPLALALFSVPVMASSPAAVPLSGFPHALTLHWHAQPWAVSYSVEIDCFGCCRTRRWCSDVGAPYRIVTGLTRPRYRFQSTDPHPMRWRAWGVAAGGRPGPKGPWSAVGAGS